MKKYQARIKTRIPRHYLFNSARLVHIPMSGQAPSGVLSMIADLREYTKLSAPNPTIRKAWNYIIGNVYLQGEWACIDIAVNTPQPVKKQLVTHFNKYFLYNDKSYRWGHKNMYIALGPCTRRQTKVWSKSGSRTKYTRFTAV